MRQRYRFPGYRIVREMIIKGQSGTWDDFVHSSTGRALRRRLPFICSFLDNRKNILILKLV